MYACVCGSASEHACRDLRLYELKCEEPENRATGTTFRCTATDETGAVWEFEGEIVAGDEYRLEVRRAP